MRKKKGGKEEKRKRGGSKEYAGRIEIDIAR
jgi:hypothetical protein